MKVALVYNRESRKVINLFGVPNRERIGLKTIQRVADALKEHGHQVRTIEGDKDLIPNLEQFMPRVVKGERPGLVFNVSYGIQGQARYTHVPSILEMVGIPYVGSGPLAHSLALDKVVTKMILREHGLPTPAFAVLDHPEADPPDLPYPLIVKPKNEAVSFGLKVVHDDEELREAAGVIFREYGQAVLVEQYVQGREVNVGILGSSPPEPLPPCEIHFGEGGPDIYTYEDKTGRSGREIRLSCPADIGDELTRHAQDIALGAFRALGCADCARVDMRMDAEGSLYVLEVNSLPSLGPHGSYVRAAEEVGLDFPGLVNALVESASARYFGTPHPPVVSGRGAAPRERLFTWLTQRRDRLERRVGEWVTRGSRTSDPVGVQAAAEELGQVLTETGMRPVAELSDARSVHVWETEAGLEGGTLLVAHVDVPVAAEIPRQPFRRDPERLFGEGIGSSRAPLAQLEFTLRALRAARLLPRIPVGVLAYLDEGRDARYSAELIARAAARAGRVLVLRPGLDADRVITQRRGRRTFRWSVEGRPRRLGQGGASRPVLERICEQVPAIAALSSRKDGLSIAVTELRTSAFPTLLPHQVTAAIAMSHRETEAADAAETRLRALLESGRRQATVRRVADRPPLRERRGTTRLAKSLCAVAKEWDVPLGTGTSSWPSVAGLVPAKVPVLCGVAPTAHDLHTPHESIDRTSLLQRTLILTQFLARESGATP